jgi:hypothetical protein
MRNLFLLVVFTGAHFAVAQDIAVAEQLAGCYVLRVLTEHHTTRKVEILPRRFQLTTRPSSYQYGTSRKRFVARNLDSKIRWDLSTSSWTVTNDGSLQIAWSTGNVGCGMLVKGFKDSFRGTARYWADTDPDPFDARSIRNSIAVAVHRVECKDSEK